MITDREAIKIRCLKFAEVGKEIEKGLLICLDRSKIVFFKEAAKGTNHSNSGKFLRDGLRSNVAALLPGSPFCASALGD